MKKSGTPSFAKIWASLILVGCALTACTQTQSLLLPPSPSVLSPQGKTQEPSTAPAKADPREVKVGERLFRETRFAQYFFAQSHGDANAKLEHGDPIMDRTLTRVGSLANPYAGRGINCVSCHFVAEHTAASGGGSRNYSDFVARSPIPFRAEDGKTHTLRNSPGFVNSTYSVGKPLFLHFDGEFTTVEDLARGGFTGRNFGWLDSEKGTAIAHIAHVVRDDDGSDQLGQDIGGSYAKIMNAPELPESYRLDVAHATDEQVFDGVAKLVGAYLNSLIYSQDETGAFNGSPYDVFLKKNALPQKQAEGESALAYSKRLARALDALKTPQWVDSKDGKLELHQQEFAFGVKELAGLKTFLGRGQCAQCHTPPAFTDGLFHNTGASQEEYDGVHGQGAFVRLQIPRWSDRIGHDWSQFQDVPAKAHPERVDLGVWGAYGKTGLPKPQPLLTQIFCEMNRSTLQGNCSPEKILDLMIATFKTPSIRDLGQSDPYLHTGAAATIEDAVAHYFVQSRLAAQGRVRNADPLLRTIDITMRDVPEVAAFLRSLNEDYH